MTREQGVIKQHNIRDVIYVCPQRPLNVLLNKLMNPDLQKNKLSHFRTSFGAKQLMVIRDKSVTLQFMNNNGVNENLQTYL